MTDRIEEAAAEYRREITLRKFNPGAMQTDQEIIEQFVVRTRQFESVMEVIRENMSSPINQHVLIVAPRGRGKTMLLARVAAEIRQQAELAVLLPVRFMEESMEVMNIADFWLECLLHLANALKANHPERASDLRESREELALLMDDKVLEERARAAVLNITDELNLRLVLMLENLQELASDADEDFGWKLRKTLQTEPRIMLVASATTRFSALNNAKAAFFELFREIQLPPLDNEECRRLWQVATGNAISAREIRPLQILTGGSPRLLVLIAGFSRHHSMRQLMEELVTLIDDHTEYFRGHLDALPPKERRVYLALIDLWQPSTAREIAQRARMDIRTASSLLGRLTTRGAVTVEQESPRKKYYSAAERLYSIYYKLRRERNEAAVVQGLVQFMTAFYTGPELEPAVSSLIKECRQIEALHQGLKQAVCTDTETRKRLLELMSFDDFSQVSGTSGDATDWAKRRIELAKEAEKCFDIKKANEYFSEVIHAFRNACEPLLLRLVSEAWRSRGIYRSIESFSGDPMEDWKPFVNFAGKEQALDLQISVATLIWFASFIDDGAYFKQLYAIWYDVVPEIGGEFTNSTIEFISLHEKQLKVILNVLQSNESRRDEARPLITALHQELGDDVRAPKEILDLAADIRGRIELSRKT